MVYITTALFTLLPKSAALQAYIMTVYNHTTNTAVKSTSKLVTSFTLQMQSHGEGLQPDLFHATITTTIFIVFAEMNVSALDILHFNVSDKIQHCNRAAPVQYQTSYYNPPPPPPPKKKNKIRRNLFIIVRKTTSD